MKRIILAAFAVSLVATAAYALDATSPIIAQNGNLSLTGNDTQGNVLLSNGSAYVATTVAECTAADKALRLNYNGGSNPTFSCGTVSISTSTVPAVLSFTSETKIASGSTTVYMAPGGRVSATENNVRTPIASASTFGKISCLASADPHSSSSAGIAVTLISGACDSGSTLTASNVDSTVTAAITATADSSAGDTVTVSAGQCIALKLVPASTDTAVFVNCTIERTA